ncbi:hypothetical protein [Breoghania sp.]|uniref:hypothetical protein n=1 Tax=Breoghania sp. TaxID=2065378 RepID=UPI0026038511|nr:hypothetical protein [Breoghania sp.]MDJ0929715.1 hypothetical protein [Breoghania sp.]
MNGKLTSDRTFRLPSSRNLAVAALAACLTAASLTMPAFAQPQLSDALASVAKGTETSTIIDGITNSQGRGDRLAVTVARVAGHQGTAESTRDMNIWVGEVELKGRKTVWVELIDKYGEVVYDAEVKKNETYLLPDGCAIVVRALPDGTQIAELNTERVASDANLVVTRRVVEKDQEPTSVEFFEEQATDATQPREPEKESALVVLAHFGERVWASITAFVSGAADNIRYTFRWIVDVATA